jgi:hypothetical protein
MFNKVVFFFLVAFLFFGLVVDAAPSGTVDKKGLKQLKLKRGDTPYKRAEAKPPKPS